MAYLLIDSPVGCADGCRDGHSTASLELNECLYALEQCYVSLAVISKKYRSYCEDDVNFVINTGLFDYLQLYGLAVTLQSTNEDFAKLRDCSNAFNISAIDDPSCVCSDDCLERSLTADFLNHSSSDNPSSIGRFVARYALDPPPYVKLTPLDPDNCIDFPYSFVEVSLGTDNLERTSTQTSATPRVRSRTCVTPSVDSHPCRLTLPT